MDDDFFLNAMFGEIVHTVKNIIMILMMMIMMKHVLLRKCFLA